MALKLKKQLSSNGVNLDVTFQPIIEITCMVTSKFKTNSMINATVFNTVEDFANHNRSGLNDIDQIKGLRQISIGTPESDNEGANIVEKFNLYLNNIAKAKILADNPSWVDADIEIVNINVI